MSSANELAAQALASARAAGAIGAEVLLSEQEDATWSTRSSGRIRSSPEIVSEASQSASISLRVYHSGGCGGHATATAQTAAALGAALPELVARATTAAASAAPDPLAGPPDRMDINTRGLSICDPRRGRLTDEDRKDILRWNWGATRSVSARMRPMMFELEERFQTRVYASSRRINTTEQSTWYRIHGTVGTNARGDERLSTGEVISRHFSDIASRPLGTELGRRLEVGDRTTRMPSGSLALVMEPHLVATILGLLPPAFDATRLEADTSCLRSLYGTRIAPSGLHIVDDASVSGGLASRCFDARGVPSFPIPLLQDGIPSGVYLSPEQARRRDSRPTGHVGPSGGLWPGNILLRPGTRTRNMLFAELTRYLVAIDTITPPTLDIETGRLVLDVWLLLDGTDRNPGKLGAYRIETTLRDFLASATLVASDQSRYGAVVSCTVITEGLPLQEL